MSAMDVTGLAAILVVLLFVFISQLPPVCKCASVDLFSAPNSKLIPSAQREDTIRIAVARDGSVFFGSNRVAPDQLVTPIRLAVSRGAERKVYLNVDGRARYGDVNIVLNKVSAAYVEQVSFLTESKSGAR